MARVRILGIDPGTARTGYGVVDRDGSSLNHVASGLISTPAGEDPAKRLAMLTEQLSEVLDTHQPEVVAVEKLFFSSNVSTAMRVAEARGVLIATCATAKLPVVEYTPPQIKQTVSGYGGAGKTQVTTMVVKLLGLKEAPKPDDVADALAIALCHDAHHGLASKLNQT